MVRTRAICVGLATVVGLSASVVAPPSSASAATAAVTVALPWSHPGWAPTDLYAVSCAGGACLGLATVMTNGDPDNTTYLYELATRSSAGVWSTLPLPADLSDPSAVSCTGPDQCVVVGASPQGPAAFTWSAGAWTSVPLPLPAGTTVPVVGALSCIGSSCTAVGSVWIASYSTAPVVWTLTGGTWSATELAEPQGSDYQLTSVSCPLASYCTATGTSGSIEPSPVYVAYEKLGSWTTDEVSVPTSIGGGQLDEPPAISCFAAGSCEGVAQASGNTGIALGISGTSVSFSSLSNVPGQTGENLSAIDCTAPAGCLAVGVSHGTGPGGTPLAATLSGGTWTQTLLPDAGVPVALDAVSCWAMASCEAVGGTDGLTLTGTTWAADASAVAPPPAAWLAADACPTSTFCVAVGSFVGPVGNGKPMIETRHGSAWSASIPALPPRATGGYLSSVSCAAAGSCVAVGGIASGGWADVLSSGRWTPTTLPASPGWKIGAIAAVSCPVVTSCVAVGYQTKTGGALSAIVERRAGGRWTAYRPRMRDTALSAVSCWAAQSCVAVGAYQKGSSFVTLVESLVGGVWRASMAPLPRGGSGEALSGVSCSSARACVLVGSYTAAPPGPQPAPLLVAGPAVGPWRSTGLNTPGYFTSVGCNGARRCVAVGEPPVYSPHQYDPGDPLLYERTPTGRWISFGAPPPPVVGWITLSGGACAPTGGCTAVGAGNPYPNSAVPVVATIH